MKKAKSRIKLNRFEELVNYKTWREDLSINKWKKFAIEKWQWILDIENFFVLFYILNYLFKREISCQNITRGVKFIEKLVAEWKIFKTLLGDWVIECYSKFHRNCLKKKKKDENCVYIKIHLWIFISIFFLCLQCEMKWNEI